MASPRSPGSTRSVASSLFEVSPFYHYNDANYQPNPNDLPTATNARQTGQYTGAQAYVSTTIARNSIKAGLYGYGQHENDLFSTVFNDGSAPNFSETSRGQRRRRRSLHRRQLPSHLLADSHRRRAPDATSRPQSQKTQSTRASAWPCRFRNSAGSSAASTATSTNRRHSPASPAPALTYAQSSNTSFVPLRGERDEEHQFGVQIPFAAGCSTPTPSRPAANNFLDHNNIGESSIFIPVTVQGALIQGLGAHPRSPRLWRYRPGAPGLFQPDRPADRRHHRRPHLLTHRFCPPTPAPSRPAIRRSTTTSATR